jgi:DNA replication protein DnaC
MRLKKHGRREFIQALRLLETFALDEVSGAIEDALLSRKENLLLLGNSGTGKTHIALALGQSACQRGHRVRFTTAAALVSELIEARADKHLLLLPEAAGEL